MVRCLGIKSVDWEATRKFKLVSKNNLTYIFKYWRCMFVHFHVDPGIHIVHVCNTYMCACVYVFLRRCGGQRTTSSVIPQGPPTLCFSRYRVYHWFGTHWPGLASWWEIPRVSVYLSNRTCKSIPRPRILEQRSGDWLRFSWMQGKHFTNGTIPSLLIYALRVQDVTGREAATMGSFHHNLEKKMILAWTRINKIQMYFASWLERPTYHIKCRNKFLNMG